MSLADMDLFARFLSGFCKATNNEEPARVYFTSTSLIDLCIQVLTTSHKPSRNIAHLILIEYLIYIEDSNEKLDMDKLDNIYDNLRADKIEDTSKYTILFKLFAIKWYHDTDVISRGISHLAKAHKNGKLND